MTGDNERYKKRRYVTECSACGAMLATLEYAATRKDGRFVRCSTEWNARWRDRIVCGKINWATDASEQRPPRWSENQKPADPEDVIGRVDSATVEEST